MFLWVIAGLTLLVGSAVFADYWRTLPPDVVATYVGRESCVDCHRAEAELYRGSDHDCAMDLATDETVLGDFNDATLEHDSMVSRMFRDGQKFMVHTEGETGQMEDFEVKYVFGDKPLKQYMVEFDRDESTMPGEIPRVQVLRITWDTEAKRWYYLRPPDVTDKLAPDDPLHWTGIAQRWQTMCAYCHSTDLKTGYDPATQRYHTTFSEIDVSCEACHGPGSLHVELAQSRRLFWDRKIGYGLTRLKGDDPQAQLQSCAPCHSRRGQLTDAFLPGDKYHDHFSLELLQPEIYYDDGQIKDEVYVYGSFTQSLMYHKGIRCTDCHDPHSLKLKATGNETCTSCHQHPAGKYDVPSHHHHAVGSEGAQCVNCHMPGRYYMDVDFRRDHSLRVPRPDISVDHGTPNACSSCHVQDRIERLPAEVRDSFSNYANWLDAAERGDGQIAELIQETDRWCDDACNRWYGDQRKVPPHYAEAIAGLRRGDPGSVENALSLALRRDEITPALVRATAIDNLAGSGDPKAAAAAIQLLRDASDHPLVRARSVRGLDSADPSVVKRVLLPQLTDASRLVRIEVSQRLASAEVYSSLTASERTQVDLALREVEEMLHVASDRAGAHLQWAMLCEQRDKVPQAIAAYETAMRVEPGMVGARTNLAALLERLAERGDTRAAARARALREEELPLLARDSALAPDNPALRYRYGLALYLSGDHSAALEQLEAAAKLAPEVPDYAVAVELLREKMGQAPPPAANADDVK